MSSVVWDNAHRDWVRRPTRWGMWIFVALQVVMALVMVFLLVYAVNVSQSSCDFSQRTCNDIAGWGTLFVFGIVLAVWTAIDVIVGMTIIIIHFSSKVF